MTTSKTLLSPIKVGNKQLSHRVVLAPLTRLRASPEAVPTDLQAEYYKQRASEGGLLIAEATFISHFGGGVPHIPGIYTPQQIEAWKKVTSAVHEKKGVIYLQIVSLGRGGSKVFHPNGEQIASASAIVVPGNNIFSNLPYETPRALTIDEIRSHVQDFRQAALNAIEAGFDGIEIHGANGFLVDQFINSGSNKRTDIYGGSIEKRARFPLEVISAIAEAIGADRTSIRLSPGGTYQGVSDDTTVQTWSYLTSEIQARFPDLSYLHFIEPRGDSFGETANTEDSLEVYRKLWKGPIITSGGFSNSIDHAYQVAEKTGNLISFGRSFIANPDLPERLARGEKLNKYDRNTFYTNDAEGYIDYPFLDAKK